MIRRIAPDHVSCAVLTAGFVLLLMPLLLHGQGRGRGPAPPLAPQAAAPVDITGYWVSVVTEDWRYRMVTPAKGDYQSVPLNAEGKRLADLWNPATDEAAGEQCKSYGAPAIMRVPARVHITWKDESTLQVDIDAGIQTRLIHFQQPSFAIVSQGGADQVLRVPPPESATSASASSSAERTWQGNSVAEWEYAADANGKLLIPIKGSAESSTNPTGDLKVVTTNLRPGYLRKNGVPYSGNAIVTEYFARTNEDNGDSWLIVTTMVDDPQYLRARFVTSSHFKKQTDASGWNPTACEAR